MPRPRIAPELIEMIWAAPMTEPPEALGARLGVSEGTVKNYRRQLRAERQEAAAEAIAEHVQATVPDALADLNELRRLSADHYRETGNPRHGALWLNAVKTTLEHVSPTDADLDAVVERELALLATNGQAAAHRED